MIYDGSEHYNPDPKIEVMNALSANPIDSVRETLQRRLATETGLITRGKRPDGGAIERAKLQLGYLDSLSDQVK